MNGEVEDWGENRFGVRLALSVNDIDMMIHNLSVLRKDSEQHFHITSVTSKENRLGDIEISVADTDQPNNLCLSSMALAPGTEISDPPSRRRDSKRALIRPLVIWMFWVIGIVAGLEAAKAAYAAFGKTEAIVIQGVWMTAVALIALHCTTLLTKRWKARIPGVIGALLLFSVLNDILRRLA